ncbi:MAG TPA: membrane-bound lytic murein transglycosylase MltF, partial [Rhodocyclaceae bacterium]
LAGCGRLDPPEKNGELVVAIRSGPSSYQLEDGKANGFEHDMVQAFADYLKLPVRFIPVGNQLELRELVKTGKVHFAAAASIEDGLELQFTPPLRETDAILVGPASDLDFPTDGAELDGKRVEAMVASPQAIALARMAGNPPKFTLLERTGVGEFELLQDVADQKADFAATDLLQFHLALQFLPNLEVAMALPGRLRFGWGFAPTNKALLEKARAFIEGANRDGTTARMKDRYFGHIERIKPQGIADFIEDIQTRLSHYRKDFQDAQAASGIDWRLIAALAYQESKWDPLATSPTNVRGMMMLTEDTADRLRVSNRLDARQSIRAGARYLADLRDELPDEIPEPDRTWMALATYNLGQGHMNGAFAIAFGLKRDTNSWFEMKKVLPLMARPEYYARLKSGKARGGEAVIMVENIRTFHDILSHFEPAWRPTPLPVRGFGLKLPAGR